jgi:RHS repeat-associated protein
MGNVTNISYDANGNRIAVTDPMGKITRFGYDAMNRLVSVTDPAGSITSFAYDPRGLPTRKTDPLQMITSLIYDAVGRPTSSTDRNGATLSYAYTATGRLASIAYPGGAHLNHTYDELGRITQMQDSLGINSYGYDQASRITTVTDANGFVVGYSYDEMGNLTTLTYPDGSAVTYSYDVLNRLTTVTNPQGETATYTYDWAGRLAIFTHFNGIITTYSYDRASRLLGMYNIVSSYQLSLDENGNRIHSLQNEPLTATPSSAATSYGYNAQKNRLLSAGPLSYAYDGEGQLASAGATAHSFDHHHRLVGIGGTTQFSYDGRGNRLQAVRAGLTTRYIYDHWGNLLAEADGSNQITRKYIHGRGLLAVATSAARYCYHFNAIGNTVALTDMSQNVVNSYAYDPFGTVLNQAETVSQPFKFVGRYGVMAEPNGLYYMRARYYDPTVGRFISEDPIGFAGGDVNLYAYVQNDPVNRRDPYGLKGFLSHWDEFRVDSKTGAIYYNDMTWALLTEDGRYISVEGKEIPLPAGCRHDVSVSPAGYLIANAVAAMNAEDFKYLGYINEGISFAAKAGIAYVTASPRLGAITYDIMSMVLGTIYGQPTNIPKIPIDPLINPP